MSQEKSRVLTPEKEWVEIQHWEGAVVVYHEGRLMRIDEVPKPFLQGGYDKEEEGWTG